MLSSRDVLLYFAYKYDSNMEKIRDALNRKEQIKESDAEEVKSKVKCDFMTIVDKDYPDALKTIYNPPLVLFYKGNIELIKGNENRKVAIIGSRNASEYGIGAVKKIVDDFSTDVVTISGLAKGIDSEAHKSSLRRDIKTIGIIGSGFDNFYPKENESLANEIVNNGGLLLTEYFPTVSPKPENFVERNRIIAALCNFLVVAEAYSKSGTSITVNQALLYGKDVGCVPYPIDKNSVCNNWIQQGALLIERGKDVLENLKI